VFSPAAFFVEIVTRSPFPGDRSKHTVIARTCRVNRCRATTPCEQHDQVILRFNVDGQELREARLSKIAFREQLSELSKDPREIFHMLAEFVLAANGEHRPLKPELLGEGVALL
jgi:hypothetical protein